MKFWKKKNINVTTINREKASFQIENESRIISEINELTLNPIL